MKWTFPHYKNKEKTRFYIKKDFSCKQGEVALIGTHYNTGKGMTIMTIFTKSQLAGPLRFANLPILGGRILRLWK